MKSRLQFNLAIIIFVAMMAPSMAAAGGYRSVRNSVEAAVELLKVESGRDRAMTSRIMNTANLRKTRQTLQSSVTAKGKLLLRLDDIKKSGFLRPKDKKQLLRAVDLVRQTKAAEEKIAQAKGISHRYRKNTSSAIKGNISKKEEAISIFQRWMAGR